MKQIEHIEEKIEKTDNVATPSSINLLNRPAWVPPKMPTTRDGAFDFQAWPSKGGD